MKKLFSYKNKKIKKEEVSENPFDLLDKVNMLNYEDGKLTETPFYTVEKTTRSFKASANIGFKGLFNAGIEYLKETTQSNNTNELNDGGESSAQIGSSGYYAQIGSSGYYAKIGSSGDYAKIGSSGNSAKIGSSGDYAKIGSSGYYAQIGSSGNSAKIDITGEYSIGMLAGCNSAIKGINGTWFALAEYSRVNGKTIPVFIKSAQIGNEYYKDYKGKVLEENTYYKLHNKEFIPIEIIDGFEMVVTSKRKVDNYTILKTQYFSDYVEGEDKTTFVAILGELKAHGDTIEDAIQDVLFKRLSQKDVKKHIERVTKKGTMTATDYRLLTGACRNGTKRWLEEKGFSWEDSKSIEEVIELTKGEYGHEILKGHLLKYKKENKQ